MIRPFITTGLAALAIGLAGCAAEPPAAPVVSQPGDSGAAEYIERMTDLLQGGAQPAEDDPAFDCRFHGNQVCGVGNANGVPAGKYVEGRKVN